MNPLVLIQSVNLILQSAKGILEALDVSGEVTPEDLAATKAEMDEVHTRLMQKIADAG